jgi:hypothetical protein
MAAHSSVSLLSSAKPEVSDTWPIVGSRLGAMQKYENSPRCKAICGLYLHTPRQVIPETMKDGSWRGNGGAG